MSTSSNGIEPYRIISSDNGVGPQAVRILRPTEPAPGWRIIFSSSCRLKKGWVPLSGRHGHDALAQCAEPVQPDDYRAHIRHRSLVRGQSHRPEYPIRDIHDQGPGTLGKKELAVSGHEQNWLIGFSKAGIGAQDLILRHPHIFTLAASWDFPADMSQYSQYGPSSTVGYGTNANFQDNYRLTAAFMDAHKGPFLRRNRIWIGGYAAFRTDVSDYAALLTSEGIAYSGQTPLYRAHGWYSGWVAAALAALYQDSINWSASA